MSLHSKIENIMLDSMLQTGRRHGICLLGTGGLICGGAQCVLNEDVKEENEFCLGSVVMGISYFFYTVIKYLTT